MGVSIAKSFPNAFGYDRLASYPISDMAGFDSATVFTVTGDVLIKTFGIVGATAITCTSGTTTLSLGVTGAVQALIANTTINNTTLFTAGSVWVDTSPNLPAEAISTAAFTVGGGSGADILMTRSADDITAGSMTLYCIWRPLSPGASVV